MFTNTHLGSTLIFKFKIITIYKYISNETLILKLVILSETLTYLKDQNLKR